MKHKTKVIAFNEAISQGSPGTYRFFYGNISTKEPHTKEILSIKNWTKTKQKGRKNKIFNENNQKSKKRENKKAVNLLLKEIVFERNLEEENIEDYKQFLLKKELAALAIEEKFQSPKRRRTRIPNLFKEEKQ
jgi:hypothetical protein